MSDACSHCGNTVDVRRFCPACGTEQERQTRAERSGDPWLGARIADRYEIVELLNTGGMGRVYRGLQHPLGRPVAVKFIHAHLIEAEGVAARFLIEAQAASRLNHPNVVSIYDFGQTTRQAGTHLYLVMELLSGPDLSEVLARERTLPLPRIASIFQQVLAALGEAHHVGITHRDVKPDNVILEPLRSGGDNVKVIDFGIAKLSDDRGITRAGHVIGTPEFMAPEQMLGEPAGPSADLYAVGVMLFQVLTCQLPFEGTPDEIVAQQRTPPDPRQVVPERKIPARLAEVCVRALAPTPAKRYPDAEALAEAIVRAATSRSWSRHDASLFPPRPSPIPATTVPASPIEAPKGSAWPLLGRDADLAWVQERLASPDSNAIFIYGRTGVGKSRLLAEVGALAEQAGDRVVQVSVEPPPREQVGYAGLARIVEALVPPPLLRAPEIEADALARLNLRTPTEPRADAPSLGFLAAARLRDAANRAAENAGERTLTLLIDDVDRLDPASWTALEVLLIGPPVPGLRLVLTGTERLTSQLERHVDRHELRGLSAKDAATLLGARVAKALPRDRDLEPLYLELVHHGDPEADIPAALFDLVASRIEGMSPAERRVLQALGVTGGGLLPPVASLLSRPADLDDAAPSLVEQGFVHVQGDSYELTHVLFGEVAVATAPLGAIHALHVRAAEELAGRRELLELRAHHAIRGEPDFAAFLLVEESARTRSLRGDHEGAIAMLKSAVATARAQASRGEDEAQRAWVLFGQKLGASLIEAGRHDEALSVLKEILGLLGTQDRVRALVLEQLARVATHRGRTHEAQQHRVAALEIAERVGDRLLAERLRGAWDRRPAGR